MNVYGYLIAFAAAMGGLLFGYEVGVVSQVLEMDGFKLQFGASIRNSTGSIVPGTSEESLPALTTFTFLVGCVVGALIVSYIADILGRKYSILIGAIGFILGGLLQTFSEEIGMFFAGRVVSGIAIGILSMCAPLYISEAAPSSIRGRMLTVQQLMVTIGIVIASIVNSILIVTLGRSRQLNLEWRLALGLQCVPALVLAIIMFVMPESPRWLATRGRNSEAIAIIARLRSEKVADAGTVAEYKTITDDVEMEKRAGNGSWKELLVKGIRNRLFICIAIQAWQQWSGINVILYYQGSLLQGMGIDKDQAAIPFTLANNFINFIATFPGMYLIEILGRRKLLIIGGFGMGIAHFLVCLFVGLSKTTPGFSWGAILSVYIFFFCFASTWGPIAWVYQSEVFPMRVRAKGTGAATMSNWFWNAIIALITPYIAKAIDFYLYLIFGSAGILMALFVIFFVPETMGKSLEQMDEVFGVPRTSKNAEPFDTQETVVLVSTNSEREKSMNGISHESHVTE